jgi:hypothetical protein
VAPWRGERRRSDRRARNGQQYAQDQRKTAIPPARNGAHDLIMPRSSGETNHRRAAARRYSLNRTRFLSIYMREPQVMRSAAPGEKL